VIQLMVQRQHLQREGLLSIVELAIAMNTEHRPRLSEIKNTLIG
jgi:hypothetical protein